MNGYEAETEFYKAFQYLANYHLKKGQLEVAYTYANKCIEYDEVIFFISLCMMFHSISFYYYRQKNKGRHYLRLLLQVEVKGKWMF